MLITLYNISYQFCVFTSDNKKKNVVEIKEILIMQQKKEK